MIHSLLELTKNLVIQPSITPDDHTCQNIITHYLKNLNFYIESMRFQDTKNIWAFRYGYKNKHQKPRTLLFVGHTDVVSPGNIQDWNYPPFSGLIKHGILYGRGAADMKGSLAAMLIAAKDFIKHYPNYTERIAFLITSDEEGLGLNGTVKVVETLLKRNEHIDYCVIGEPSSQLKIGDVIKNGRRGSYTGKLIIKGSQGHVAYPQFLKNPIHLIIPALSELVNTTWDLEKSILFPPTSIQITKVHSIPNHISNNVTPSQLILNFNFRFNDKCSIDNIQNNINQILSKYAIDYQIDWEMPSKPYFSKPGLLTKTITDIIQHYHNITPKLETTGGTSDGRFIAKTGAEIIELGALNNTIHKVNECISLTDLKKLNHIYFHIMKKLLL